MSILGGIGVVDTQHIRVNARGLHGGLTPIWGIAF